MTLRTEALLLALHARLGGDLTRIAIARAGPLAGVTLMAAGHAGDAMGWAMGQSAP